MEELNKSVTLGKGVVLAVMMVVGSGLLGLPGLVANIGTVQEVVFGWILIILAVAPLIQFFSSLGTKFPCSEGLSCYARRAVGEWGGSSVTALVCSSFVLGEPAVALMGGEYMTHLFDFPDYEVYLLAAFIITITTFINLFGVNILSIFNYAALGISLFLITTLVYFNFLFFISGLDFSLHAIFEGIASIAGFGQTIPNPHKVWEISAMLLWAFQGWDTMSFGLGELQNPEKNVKRIFWLSFGLVIFIYIMLAITSIGADAAGIPLSGASGLVELVKLTPLGNLLIWLICIIIIANITSWNFASSRLLYASSLEGVLPSYLGKLSKNGQPTTSILSMYVAFLFVLSGAYLFRIPISFLIMLVNQNCILLYGFILLSYWKIETGRGRWVYSGLSLVSLSFLISGFTWEILYSIALIGIGYYGFLMKTTRQKNKEEKAVYQTYSNP